MKRTKKILLQLVEIPDEMASEPSYFYEELKEFFENYGWKVVKSNLEDSNASD